MATGAQVWSILPTNNATSDSNVNWAEGMAPSQVNDSARAMMASVAKYISDNNGTLITSGSSAALTVTTNQVESTLTSGYTVTATLGTAVSGGASLAVDGLSPQPIYTSLSTASAVTTGTFAANQILSFIYSTGVSGWVVAYNSPSASATSLSPALLTSVTASLASSVALSTSAYTDGPSVTAGSSGTWFVSGAVTFNPNNGTGVFLKLWDGTNLIASGAIPLPTAGGSLGSMTLSGTITSPAGNLKISGQMTAAGGAGGFVQSVNSTTNACTITAIRTA